MEGLAVLTSDSCFSVDCEYWLSVWVEDGYFT